MTKFVPRKLLIKVGTFPVFCPTISYISEPFTLLPGSYSVLYDLATGEPTYRLSQGNRILPLDEVINPRVFGGPFGKSPLTLAREAVGLCLLMEQHAARLFARGGRPSGILRVGGKLSPKATEDLRTAWQSAHGGSESGKTAVLQDGTEWQQISLTSVDAQFLELRQFQILEIARAFRVSPHLLFELGRVTYANIESLGREFLVFCLQPIHRTWESALTRALLTPDERTQYAIEFREDDLTQGNIVDRATAYSSLISSRIINPNEARAWEGCLPTKAATNLVIQTPRQPRRPSPTLRPILSDDFAWWSRDHDPLRMQSRLRCCRQWRAFRNRLAVRFGGSHRRHD